MDLEIVWTAFDRIKWFIAGIVVLFYTTPKILRDFRYKVLGRNPMIRRLVEPRLQWLDRKFGIWKADLYPSYIPDNEHEFYEIFAKRLSTAKEEVFNSGDGFNMKYADDSGVLKDDIRGSEVFATSDEKANFLDVAMSRAMKENASLVVHRFQIVSACNINWINRLITMVEEHKEDGEDYGQFRVYMDERYDHIGCFCAIDPDRKKCVYEWQLISGRKSMVGTESKGFGFTYRNEQICQRVKKLFLGHQTDGVDGQPERDEEGKRIKLVGGITTGGALTVEELREWQRRLWNMRVESYLTASENGIKNDPLDAEIVSAIENLQERRRLENPSTTLTLEDRKDLPFPDDLSRHYPLPKVTVDQIIEQHRKIAKKNGSPIDWV